jgi:hypothetical protein
MEEEQDIPPSSSSSFMGGPHVGAAFHAVNANAVGMQPPFVAVAQAAPTMAPPGAGELNVIASDTFRKQPVELGDRDHFVIGGADLTGTAVGGGRSGGAAANVIAGGAGGGAGGVTGGAGGVLQPPANSAAAASPASFLAAQAAGSGFPVVAGSGLRLRDDRRLESGGVPHLSASASVSVAAPPAASAAASGGTPPRERRSSTGLLFHFADVVTPWGMRAVAKAQERRPQLWEQGAFPLLDVYNPPSGLDASGLRYTNPSRVGGGPEERQRHLTARYYAGRATNCYDGGYFRLHLDGAEVMAFSFMNTIIFEHMLSDTPPVLKRKPDSAPDRVKGPCEFCRKEVRHHCEKCIDGASGRHYFLCRTCDETVHQPRVRMRAFYLAMRHMGEVRSRMNDRLLAAPAAASSSSSAMEGQLKDAGPSK